VLFPGTVPDVPAYTVKVHAKFPAERPAIRGVVGAHPGRTSAGQVTVYGGVGLAFQDLVAAWQVYRAARAKGAGREIDLLA
jgi:ornithine cyclodeaminase